MQYVKHKITNHLVAVLMVSLVILIQVAMNLQESVRLKQDSFYKQMSEVIPKILVDEPINPCVPSPCGPNSQCKVINSHAVCSCTAGYMGMPPNCRPECVVSSECAQDKACLNQKCVDPCPGTCGSNARCNVLNHSPICSCPSGYTGDPFIQCLIERSEI